MNTAVIVPRVRRLGSPAFLLALMFLTFTSMAKALSIEDFALPAQDAQGWTILTPEADSRIIYVDAVNGNDSTAQIYSISSPAVGSNPRQPAGAVLAFRTLAAAYAQMRNGYPDWTLLRAGQVWENESLRLGHGRSATERQVVTSWGTGARPELRTGALRGIAGYQASNVILKGIKFWAHTRDFFGPYFVSYDGSLGFEMYNAPVTMPEKPIRDVLFEDCVFRAYANNVLTGIYVGDPAQGPRQPITRFVLRRCIVSGNYLATSSRSQGLYYRADGQPAEVPPSVLLEGNLFDHNGWLKASDDGGVSTTEGRATQLNHNTYFTSARNVLFYGNIFLRPSSMHNKWTTQSGTEHSSSVYIENNLYAEGEIGISAGGNHAGVFRFQDMRIADNVFTDIGRNGPTGRGLAYYLGVQDWDGGVVTGNLLLNQRDPSIEGVYALRILAEGQMQDVQISNNIAYNLSAGTATSEYALLNIENGDAVSQVTFSNNVFQTPSASRVADVIGPVGGYGFDGLNGYYSTAMAGNWFTVGGSLTDLAGWKTATADAGAVVEAPAWDDPDRDLERYIAELGLGTTFEDFIDAVSAQSADNWNPLLTAPVINNWFREGFGLSTPVANVALNKPATADSNHSLSAGAAAAVDGDSGLSNATRWVSAATAWPHWLEVDLQGNHAIDRVKFWSGSANGYGNPFNYAVQAWDGSQWVTVASESANSSSQVERTFTATNTSRVRLLGTGGADNLMRVLELEVYGVPAVEPTNVFLNKSITADSNHSLSAGAAAAVDGDSGTTNATRWVSAATAWPHWLEIDLGSVHRLSRLRFWTGGNNAYGNAIQYVFQRWDGQAWQPIVTDAANTSASVDVSFAPTDARYVRLLGTGGSDSLMRIFEVEAWGTPVP